MTSELPGDPCPDRMPKVEIRLSHREPATSDLVLKLMEHLLLNSSHRCVQLCHSNHSPSFCWRVHDIEVMLSYCMLFFQIQEFCVPDIAWRKGRSPRMIMSVERRSSHTQFFLKSECHPVGSPFLPHQHSSIRGKYRHRLASIVCDLCFHSRPTCVNACDFAATTTLSSSAPVLLFFCCGAL